MSKAIENNQINGSILVVDDIPANLGILYELLSKAGLEVRLAYSGSAALKAIKNNPPDLLLLDIIMPGMDGYEVCRQLKADSKTKHIPILFLTAKNDVKDENIGLELGAVDYIRKPFHAESVLARVRNQLAIKQQIDTLLSVHSEQDYQFRLQNQGWIIRYAGGETNYLHQSRGAAYLHLLLSKPNQQILARDLVYEVVHDEAVLHKGDAGNRLDELAISAYRERYQSLISDLQEAEDNNDLGAIMQINEEKTWLEKELSAAIGLNGRRRQETSQQERFRKSVGNAIRRTLKEIERLDTHLADHLKPPCLRMGIAPIYAPSVEIPWQT